MMAITAVVLIILFIQARKTTNRMALILVYSMCTMLFYLVDSPQYWVEVSIAVGLELIIMMKAFELGTNKYYMAFISVLLCSITVNLSFFTLYIFNFDLYDRLYPHYSYLIDTLRVLELITLWLILNARAINKLFNTLFTDRINYKHSKVRAS